MEKINIAFLRTSPRRSEILLGAEEIILTLAESLDRTKFNPLVVAFKEEGDEIPPLVTMANERQIPTEVIALKGRFDFHSITKLRRLVLKNKIDIVHSHEYKSDVIAFIATRFISAKLIATTHGWIAINLKVKFYEFLDSQVLRFFDKIIAVSNIMRQELLKSRISPSKIAVIENALDFSAFQVSGSRANLIKELGLSPNAFIIGAVGRLSLERGYIYLLKAAKKVIESFPSVVFLLVGDGYLKDSLIAETERLGIKDKIYFLGFRNDIHNIISVMDIFISSSLKESFGLALVEAMAAGKAVVATKVGIALDIIKEGETGILIEPKNREAIYKAIARLLTDEKLRDKIAASAKNLIVERFSCQQMVAKYQQAYLDLVNNGKKNN